MAPLNQGNVRQAVDPGPLLEQWVGIELWRRLHYLGEGALHHLRTKHGAEIDYVVEHEGTLTPIAVKWTTRPTPSDARHVITFLAEKPRRGRHGFVICRCPHPMKLDEHVTALPWFCL